MPAPAFAHTFAAMTENPPPEVVVVGGGIAAAEFVLALRDLAGDRFAITLVAPDPDLLLRPLHVAEPLGVDVADRPSLSALGVRYVRAAVSAVDSEQHRVLLRGGGVQHYDTLVLAPGARRMPAFDDALHIGEPDALETLRDEILTGGVRNVAFVAPTLTGWLLPLYEAALLTARLGARVSLHTPEQSPLELFGDAAVDRALAAAGVEFLGGRRPGAPAPEADRIASLPLVRGPRIEGVPTTGLYDLIPIDAYGRVVGLPAAYALGDATDYPLKQGGIACQQADTAAAHIAAPLTATPFVPRVRATLLTGGEPIELGDGEAPGKVPGRYLRAWLQDDQDPQEPDHDRQRDDPPSDAAAALAERDDAEYQPDGPEEHGQDVTGDDESVADARLGGMSAHGARK
jgi:sulfide:quinone oxidoreductase